MARLIDVGKRIAVGVRKCQKIDFLNLIFAQAAAQGWTEVMTDGC